MKAREFLRHLVKRRRLLFIGLVLLLSALFIFVFRDFIYGIFVVPLLYAWWLLRVLYGTIPQVVIWGIFIVIAVRIAVGNLIAIRRRSREMSRERRTEGQGPVRIWTRRVALTAQGDYSKWRLAQHLSELALVALAQRERLTTEQTEGYLEAGKIDVPPEVRDYIQTGLMPGTPDPVGWFAKLRLRLGLGVRRFPLYIDPEKVVQFLEVEMGVRHDG